MTPKNTIPDRTFVADGLSPAQRKGRSCASCGKRWPRPRKPVGRLLDGTVLLVCDDCTVVCEAVEQHPDSTSSPSRVQ